MELLKIRVVTDEDIRLIEGWLKSEHVARWFEDAGAWLGEIRGRGGEFSYIKHFIAVYGETPIGFCQYYACAGAKEDWYGDYPVEGSYSLDYFIGDESFLGKGLGKEIIRLLVGEIFLQSGAERILAHPGEDNHASRKALIANGFVAGAEGKVLCREPRQEERNARERGYA